MLAPCAVPVTHKRRRYRDLRRDDSGRVRNTGDV